MARRAETISKLERDLFSVNDYRGRADAPAFETVEGTLPALVSAPHAVTHLRDGRIKPSEDGTGAIALVLAQLAGCHAFVATRYDDCDPNWDPYERSAYKQALVAYVQERGISLVVDVHGMVAASSAAIAIGTADGRTVKAWPEIEARACELFEKHVGPYAQAQGKPIVLNGRYAARGENSIASTVARECGIAVLQVELSTPYRVPFGRPARIPKDEPPAFAPKALSVELRTRRYELNPDAVEATLRALAELLASVDLDGDIKS